jgi:hypothetical protein
VRVLPAPGAGRRRLAVLCCALAAVGVAAPIVWATRRGDERWLHGRTQQGNELDLLLDESGRLGGVETEIEAVCKGSFRMPVGWSPRQAFARFTQDGERVAVREFRSRVLEDGRTERMFVRLKGRIPPDDRAAGTVRLVARYYRDGREVQACESGPRRWAAGPGSRRRLAEAPPMRAPRGYYWPRVPSLAGEVSAARKRFIQRTDATCAATYAPTQVALRALAAAPDRYAQIEAYGAFVEAHAGQLHALEVLGRPPDGVRQHRRWLGSTISSWPATPQGSASGSRSAPRTGPTGPMPGASSSRRTNL